jgi:hypothetical protein
MIGAHAVVIETEVGVAHAATGHGNDDFAGAGLGVERSARQRSVGRVISQR